MPAHDLTTDRFTVEVGHRILVQVPKAECDRVLAAVLEQDPLGWGDFDQVAFVAAAGQQRFRSLPGGRNAATATAVDVACVELSVFTAAGPETLRAILRAIYATHPYEEPVVLLVPALRSLHVRGSGEDNPTRFWNRPDADWVPAPHRRGDGTVQDQGRTRREGCGEGLDL